MKKNGRFPAVADEKVISGLRSRPYWQLILGTIVLTVLTVMDVATVDCLPFIDEAVLASFSTAFWVALIRKAWADFQAR